LLRLELEKFAKSINIDILTSIPLEKSYSVKILFDLGYCYNNNYFIKKI
jgi:hypothetical protein